MESNFQRSWSVYGHRSVDNNDYFQSQSNLQRTMSTRITKMNLEKRFEETNNNEGSSSEGITIPSDRPYFWKSHQQGNANKKSSSKLKFRSITDTNLRRNGVNESFKGFHQFNSPKTFHHRQPLRQIPDKIAPLWNNFQNQVNQAGPKTEKFIQKGGEKFSKAIEGVRTTLHSFSQKFKKTTRRHYKLDSNTPTRTPGRTPNRNLITPGKLYSPFDVNTPRTPHSYAGRGPKRLQAGNNSRRLPNGRENYALCRTPPPQTFRAQSVAVNKPNWVQFESPRPARIPQQELSGHYRMDSSYAHNASSLAQASQHEPPHQSTMDASSYSHKSAPPCPPEMYWK